MKLLNYKNVLTGFLLLLLMPCRAQYLPYVQPLCGTAPSTTTAALKHSEAGSEKNANTIPAVTLPFAMTQWTPQTQRTEQKCIPPYFYRDSIFKGFRASHWLSGSCTQDYGSFTVMPVIGSLHLTTGMVGFPFKHENEVSSPAYYALTTDDIKMEMTATLRCGMMRFTMLRDDSLYLLISPNSERGEGKSFINDQQQVSSVNPAHRIYQGWNEPAGFDGNLFAEVDQQQIVHGTLSDQLPTGTGTNHAVYIGCYVKKGESILMRIGTSFTSTNAAAVNLRKEIPGWDFDHLKTNAAVVWNTALAAVDIQTNSEQDKRIFYTALYHTMQQPRLFNDVDGSYPAFSRQYEFRKDATAYYDDFSMWDIYRAELPLYEILDPSLSDAFVQSLIQKATEGQWFPIFPCWNNYTTAMIGDHAVVPVASAFIKGISRTNVDSAYRYLTRNAFEQAADAEYKNGKGRRALHSYLQYGYIPMEDSVPIAFHKKEQVSRTLEYAYDDYALGMLSSYLHKTTDAALLRSRGYNYTKVFDRSVGMVRGRYINGSWVQPFNADQRESYITEGTPRQYTFYVPQDIPGLRKLMGGAKQLEQALDSLFLKDEYWHGNEPGHQVPFLYHYSSAPWKTIDVVRRILKEEYTDGAGGLSGNDDAGQMSAWYVFASMGFYPVDPVSGNYLLSVPIFDETTIHLKNGKSFTIKLHRNSTADKYIQNIHWNGAAYSKNYINYQQIMQAGLLELYLTNQPTSFGMNTKDQAPAGIQTIQ